MKNVVVKVTSKKHGAEVVQAFKDLSVDVGQAKGRVIGSYYGLFNGWFDAQQKPQDSQVITLEQLKAMKKPYPKMMWVWDYEGRSKTKQEVITEVEDKGIKGYVTFYGDSFSVWRHAKDIEEPIGMKTPIQEFFEFMEQEYFMGGDLLAKYKEMLEKEKEVMCKFAFDYNNEYCNNSKVPSVKEYFNQTFNTKQK